MFEIKMQIFKKTKQFVTLKIEKQLQMSEKIKNSIWIIYIIYQNLLLRLFLVDLSILA